MSPPSHPESGETAFHQNGACLGLPPKWSPYLEADQRLTTLIGFVLVYAPAS
jgi:hypothetical protein